MAKSRDSQGAPRAQALKVRAEADRVSAGRGSASRADEAVAEETRAAPSGKDAGRDRDAGREAPARAAPKPAAARAGAASRDDAEPPETVQDEATRPDPARVEVPRPDVSRHDVSRHGKGSEVAPATAEPAPGSLVEQPQRAPRVRSTGVTTRRRVTLVALAVILQAVAVWWAFFRTTETLETMTVHRTSIESTVSALGTLQPQRYVDVGAQVSGQISRIAVQPGDTVEKGDLLVEFDPSIQQAEVDTDRATLQSLHAQLSEQQALLTLAQQKVNRQRRMAADGSTRMEDFQTAEANLKVAQAKVQSLNAQIEGAASKLKGSEAKLGHTRIFAPMSGTVVTLDAREGQTLNAAYQTPVVMRIADLSHMTVWAEVSEADIGRVREGMPVYFTTMGLVDDKGAPRRWDSTLKQVLPAPPNRQNGAASAGAGAQEGSQVVTSKVVAYTALFDVDNADGALMPQMTARVFFVAAAANNALVVPLSALTPTGDRDTFKATVLVDGEQKQRTVRVGVRDRLQAEVQWGLEEGDVLVTGVRPAEETERLRW